MALLKIFKRLEKYIEFMDNDWDIIFDSVWGNYKDMNEEEVVSEKLVYKKVIRLQKYEWKNNFSRVNSCCSILFN